jgi:hypothetical protein
VARHSSRSVGDELAVVMATEVEQAITSEAGTVNLATECSRGSKAVQFRTLTSTILTMLYSIGAARFAVEPKVRP